MAAPDLKEEMMMLVDQGAIDVPSLAVYEGKAWLEVSVDRAELGRPDSLRYNVLNWVLEENYERALEGLNNYLNTPSEFPSFRERIERFVKHSVDLIYAIKAKRSFPGINSLTRAKQQELREKFKTHFRELQYVLKVIEKIQMDLRIQDARSTIYVVRAGWYAIIGVVVMAFYMEVTHGLAQTSSIVFEDLFGAFANWAAAILGL